jgi:hypothetical protein
VDRVAHPALNNAMPIVSSCMGFLVFIEEFLDKLFDSVATMAPGVSGAI